MPVQFAFNRDKFRAALQLLASRDLPAFDKYRAVKLLFLADKRHLVQYGRPIVGGVYRALPHGPAPGDALDHLDWAQSGLKEIGGIAFDHGFEYPRILCTLVELYLLSESERNALAEIVGEYGTKSFAELRALTHALPEYERAWEQRCGAKVSTMDVVDFFEEDPAALPGVKEAMIEDASIHDWIEARGA